MKEIKYPNKLNWPELLKRPEFERNQFTKVVSSILTEVKENGDEALIQFTEKFDGVKLDALLVSQQEVEIANSQVSEELSAAIKLAKANIEKFHEAQNITEPVIQTTKGVSCWRRSVGIEKVGLYIPGGSAPLFSTILSGTGSCPQSASAGRHSWTMVRYPASCVCSWPNPPRCRFSSPVP